MKLRLVRNNCQPKFTRGALYIDGQYECETLEDPDRHLESGGEKIYADTCIPRGTYKVTISMSARFKRRLPILLNVPQFEGVRIHPGNTTKDTEGCILVGVESDDNPAVVIMSRTTFDGVFKRLDAVYNAGEEIELEIV